MNAYLRQQKGYVALFLTAAIFSLFPIFTRLVGDKLPLFYQSWTRSVVTGSLLMVVSILATKHRPHIHRADMVWFGLRGVFGVVGFVGTFLALTHLSVNDAYMIYFSCYLVGGIAAGALLFKEKIDTVRMVSILVASVGLWIVYGQHLVRPNAYLLWSAAAGIGYSGWSLIPKKLIGAYTDLELNYIDMLLFSIVLIGISVLSHEPWLIPTTIEVWVGTVGLGIIWIVTGLTIIYGFARVDASLGSIVMLAEIPLALLVAYLVYQETLSPHQILGGILIFIAILLPELALFMYKKHRSTQIK